MEVLLDAEETEALLDVLRTYGEDLRMEIVDTDNASYKRPLKHRRELIETITTKLHTATASVTSTDGLAEREMRMRSPLRGTVSMPWPCA